jgi:transposase
VAQNFLSCDREQALLLPPSVGEWVPEGHLARFVVEVVDRLDLTGLYAAYRADGSGRPAHDPAMMVALVLYNYAVGVRSSRQIERRCVEDVACRFIAANRAPDHVTINRFRARHQDALSALFAQVLGLCARAGMVRVGTVAVDSTKMAADASLGANRTYEGLQAEARRILEEAARVDAAEDELFGEARGDELPEDLADPKTRAGRIVRLLDELEAERARAQAEHDAKRAAYEQHVRAGRRPSGRPVGAALPKERQALFARKVNLTDPDSAIVSDRGKLIQGYNVQTAVADGQVIPAATATSVANDHGQLAPMVTAAGQQLISAGVEQPIGQVVADSGYWNISHVRQLQADGLDVLVQPRPFKPQALRNKRRGPAARAMTDRLTTPQGVRHYRRRQQIVEPVFAHIKHLRAITRLLRRGRAAAQAEIDLIATTHNLLKLYRTAPA